MFEGSELWVGMGRVFERFCFAAGIQKLSGLWRGACGRRIGTVRRRNLAMMFSFKAGSISASGIVQRIFIWPREI
jgi:hypothetical protein